MAIAADSSNLYVGGFFGLLGNKTGFPANNIAKWDGANWSALISTNSINGVNRTVES